MTGQPETSTPNLKFTNYQSLFGTGLGLRTAEQLSREMWILPLSLHLSIPY